MRRFVQATLCASLILIMHAPSTHAAGAEGRWEGFITTEPGKLTLFAVHLSAGPDGWTGSADIPGTAGISLPDLRVEADMIHFALGDDPEPYVFDGRCREDAITGELVLGDTRFTVELHRLPELLDPANRVDAWRQDLDAVLNRFLAYDRSFTPRARKRFRAAIARLNASLPGMNDQQIIVALSRAVAMSGNAHTRLYLLRNRTELRRLPVRVWWFRDGLFVVSATRSQEDLAGCRVTRIAGVRPRRLRRDVSRLFAGNRSWIDYKSTYFMTSPEILYGLDIVPGMESIPFELECPGGRKVERDLPPLPLHRMKSPTEAWRDLSPLAADPGDEDVRWVGALPADTKRLPLYLRRPDQHYWREYLEEENVLYLQYNRSQNMREGPGFDEFSDGVLVFVEQHPRLRIVVDLRFNTGGDNGVAEEFLKKLAALQKDGAFAGLYVVTGRATFSAGISAAARLKQDSDASFVGEPIGDVLDIWSEGGNIVLPNSGLTVHFTNGFHSLSDVDRPENHAWLWSDLDLKDLKPDILIRLSSTDYFAGRDPVLEAILGRRD